MVEKKTVSVIMMSLLILGTLALVFDIEPVRASDGTIYIRADGSIDPQTALISTADKITYTLTGDIAGSGVVVERDNIRLDGTAHTIRNSISNMDGLVISGRNNVTVINCSISAGMGGRAVFLNYSSNCRILNSYLDSAYTTGVELDSSSNNLISGNVLIHGGGCGLYMNSSNNNIITNNGLDSDVWALTMCSSSANTIERNSLIAQYSIGAVLTLSGSSGNNLIGNTFGYDGSEPPAMSISSSTNNIIYNNNFKGNTSIVGDASSNVWDNGYPSGGNYWSGYTDVDSFKGPSQNVPGSDGIWDHPYVIDANNKDHYPLVSARVRWVPIESLVVRGMDSRIYYRVWNGTDWQGWNVLPGSTIDSPAAAVLGNQLHIVVRGSDGHSLWYGYLTNITNPGSFSGWTLLSGATSSAPTLTSNGTTLCLVVRGLDNRVYHRCYSEGNWGQWYAVPTGAIPAAPAGVMLGNYLHIVVRGMDGSSLWDTIVSCDGTVVRGWSLLSGATPSKPVLACSGPDSLCLVVRGMDNAIYYRSYTGATDSWAGWSALPTGATIDGPAATVVGNMLCTVVRGMDGSTLWCGNLELGTSSFSGWTMISGATPSTPTTSQALASSYPVSYSFTSDPSGDQGTGPSYGDIKEASVYGPMAGNTIELAMEVYGRIPDVAPLAGPTTISSFSWRFDTDKNSSTGILQGGIGVDWEILLVADGAPGDPDPGAGTWSLLKYSLANGYQSLDGTFEIVHNWQAGVDMIKVIAPLSEIGSPATFNWIAYNAYYPVWVDYAPNTGILTW